jgi:gliding motility-associated-like protein
MNHTVLFPFRGIKLLFLCGFIFLIVQSRAIAQGCDCPAVTSCGCTGGLTELTLRFDGYLLPISYNIRVTDGPGLGNTEIYNGNLSAGQTFTFTGSVANNLFDNHEVHLFVASIIPNANIETNCSTGIRVGDTFGSFTVMAAKSLTGTILCCQANIDDTTPPVLSACPSNITLPANGSCQAQATWTPPTATDNCGTTPVITSTHAPNTIFDFGTTTVTYTATDDHGNTAQCSFTVTVNDTQNPTITPPASVITVADPGSCSTSGVVLGTPVTSDNCGVQSVSSDAPTSFPVGVTTVTWTVNDVNGRSATATQTVTVNDTQDPTITPPSNIAISADAGSCSASGVVLGVPVTADNCAVQSVTNDAPSSFPVGSTTVTWTVTDVNGRTATATQTVTVNDNQNPTINPPANIVIGTSPGSCSANSVVLGTPVTSDNCAVQSVTSDAPSSFPVGMTTVTWTVTDVNGRSATATQTVTVSDTENPTITAPSNVLASADGGSCSATGILLGTPVTSDNCAVQSVSNDALANFPVGVTTVTWTVNDVNGRSATAIQTVTVNDTQDPTITAPSNIVTVAAPGSCSATGVVLGNPATSDNCAVQSVTNNAPANFPVGVTTVTWTVNDVNGRSATATQTVTVNDTQDPTITPPANVTTNTSPGSCSATSVVLGTPVTSDNCSVATVTNDSPSTFPVGVTTVTWTVTDVNGRSATATQTVTVNDNQNPSITAPANIVTQTPAGSCSVSGVALGNPVTSDNCGVLNVSNNAPSTFPLGVTTVTWTVNDINGRSATATQTVTVQDNVPPVISGCPSNITIPSGGSCQAVATWIAPTVSDNCVGTPSLVTTHAPGSTFPVGTTTVTYTATAGSLSSTCSFTVTVVDNTPPVLSGCPSDIVVFAASNCNNIVNWTPPTASDNCVATPALTSTHAPGTAFPVGETIVTYTATAGTLSAVCSFKVTVVDNTAPVITGCPTNIVVSANTSCQAVVNWTAPTASDNCGTPTLVGSHSPGSLFPLGETTVTYTATAGSLSSTCTFKVTVVDNTAPVISGCPSDIVVAANSACSAVVNWTPPTASDNCVVTPSLVSSHAPGSTFPLGQTTVTYTATAGTLSTTCTFRITVVDNSAPVFANCPSNIVISSGGSCSAVASWTPPTATDNCVVVPTVTTTHAPNTSFPVGVTTVTYTATAGALSSTCSFTVTVIDNSPPIINNCPTNRIVSANASCQAVVNWTPPTATDNCVSTPSLVSSHAPGSTFPLGETTVTYTATAGTLITTCSFKVTVVDNSPPVISGCPSDITVPADNLCQAVVNWTVPTASDNCAGVSLNSSHAPGSIFALGETIVTYTATAGSLTSTCSFKVKVVDNTAPTIAGCPSDITVSANGSCQAVVSWTAPTVSDNCVGTPTLTSNKSPGSVFPLGETTVTYTATAGALTSTCSFKVKVIDNSPPVISNCPADIVVSASTTCNKVVSWTPPTVSDNCVGAPSLVSSHTPGATFPLGETIVTYTATAGSLISTCTFKVTVVDNVAPTITGCPSDIIVSAGSSCQAIVNWTPPTATGNCVAAPLLSTTHAPGSAFPLGETTVTYSASAGALQTTCSFKVTVIDNNAPVISSCPADITVSIPSGCEAPVTWTPPTALDACNVTWTSTREPGSVLPLGKTTVTYTATDPSGNASTCSFNVTVEDRILPVFSCQTDDIVVSASSNCQAIVNWTSPTATDNCGSATVISTHSPGDNFVLGTTQVTYTATDPSGNRATCTFNVIVEDKTAPVISGCSDVIISANGKCEEVVQWNAPTVSDNCSTPVVTSSHSPGSVFPLGVTEVSYTAVDKAGNQTICKFNVIVKNDVNLSTSRCPQDIVAYSDESGKVKVEWEEPSAAVQCGKLIKAQSHKPGDAFSDGVTEVVYEFKDDFGKSEVCKFTVTVSRQEVTFDVTELLTPNGDGINDVWMLGNIEKFNDNTVTIVDRWGSVVYQQRGYNNGNVVWRGSNSNGGEVPTGTYFYTVTVKYGSRMVEKKGFLEVVR